MGGVTDGLMSPLGQEVLTLISVAERVCCGKSTGESGGEECEEQHDDRGTVQR